MRILPAFMAMFFFLSSCKMAPDDSTPLIFDTDWWTDVDDACAIRMLIKADQVGEIDLQGICLSAVCPTSYESIGKFLHFEGRDDIPLGADKEAVDFPGVSSFHPLLCGQDGPIIKEGDVLDCVDFYRSLLSKARRPVDIVAVGFPNTLSRLLESAPDGYSDLTGKDLVKKKVRHLYLMAGQYPSGREHNFCLTERSSRAGDAVLREWPGEITLLGYEIGIEVVAGGSLPKDDLLHQVLEVHGSASGRYMWDPLTLYMALKGGAENAGFSTVRGTCILDPKTGENTFEPSKSGRHEYVTFLHEPSWYAAEMEKALQP